MSPETPSGPQSVAGPDGAPLARIVAATDFSETADAALDWAVDIARQHGAGLRLIHALTLPAPLPDYVPAGADFGEELHSVALAKLEETAARVRQAGVEVELEVPVGVPSQAILRVAEESDADLVVLGTRGLTGVGHLLLGSTAERVVQRARCPVLTVHPEDRGRHRPIRNVVLPTDFSSGADQVAAVALRLLAGLEASARIVLVHAYHLPIEYTAYGPIPTSVRFLEDVGADAQERLDQAARALSREGLAVESVLREGYPPDVIVETAQEHEADLIAMGTHGRTGLAHLLLGSTAERVVQHAPCPVITVRRRDED
ncbi:MAG TPA: universal stress protein [Thermoanaerobaculia bacterium]|nr:universal stress protein [Thermoanaerobaculia bacterium]